MVATLLEWAAPQIGQHPLLVDASPVPEAIKTVQEKLGVKRAGSLVEQALAAIARGLVALGVRQLIVTSGETSGAVVKALDVSGLCIGPEIDPGVPWTSALQDDPDATPLSLTLRSGNFSSDDFFIKAWSRLS